jgi:hypothetical protein
MKEEKERMKDEDGRREEKCRKIARNLHMSKKSSTFAR